MCGITGSLRFEADLSGEALTGFTLAMIDTLTHRGPDDRGVWVDAAAGIALGHRRLSILDLSSGGAQPMTSQCGRYTIVYNGEIYNFIELRDELEATGCKFRGHSDTEVALEALVKWGAHGALERFNGMFAFALWDARERSLLLARDRAGKKPLYYCRAGGNFIFGSELKALCAHPDFRPEIDRDALGLMIQLAWIPGPSTIYRNVKKLEPGTFMRIDARGEERHESYWCAREVVERCAADPFRGDLGDAVTELERLLTEAVRGRMISDVPLGALLSGGIDSSAVVSLMQKTSNRPIRTFAIGFREPRYDEAHFAAGVARHLGTEHTDLYVTPAEAQAIIPRLPALYDEPFADVSQIPTFLVSQLARRHVTVALTGDGGDELFLGYNRYFRAAKRWKTWRHWPRGLRVAASKLIDWNGRTQWRLADSAHKAGKRPPLSARLMRQTERLDCTSSTDLSVRMLRRNHGGALVLGASEPWSATTDTTHWPQIEDARQAMGAIDFTGYLRDDILVKVDRASMGTSLEVRCPILDRRVVEFAWSLPTALRVEAGTGKIVLRRMLDRYVPRELTDRPRQGFRVPIGEWLAAELRDWTESLLDERRLKEEGFFDAAAVRRAWQQHQAGWADHGSLLWSLVMFQAWNEGRGQEPHAG
ncbi:MAG: asparagine synthase (glutamine-hydrolyzing) [Deltaproteobacteria bacterium]|nr:asparagine synthase (glutamine-hydrolyzing) [Deltaproteobacteria bacterium]MBW2362709.1 asparagine synthase (glutamine-hydrolyzing) [Deltaproteobacteria bacterium]